MNKQIERRKAGERNAYDLVFERKGGKKVIATVSPKPLFDEDGDFKGSFALFTDITERREKEEQLRSSLREKEMLLREVHHRVKNNLQVTSGLLALSALKEPHKDYIAEARNRINTIALIHTQLYEDEQLDSINIAEHLKKLIANMQHTYGTSDKRISVEVMPSAIRIPLTQSIPCCLAINEILTNAYKHAFRTQKSGKISASFEKEAGNTIHITLQDNGSGIPASAFNRAENTIGLNLAERLVQDQLKGNIDFGVKNGTKVHIRFALDKAAAGD